jgi:hypothetical protein
VTVGGLHGDFKTYAARWNGTSWKRYKTPTARGGSFLLGVSCLSGRRCIAVGGGSRIARRQRV